MNSKRITVVSRDEHGYISVRRSAKSKYWGVTTGSDSAGHNVWCVSVSCKDTGRTLSLYARDFKLKEVDAARVAAYIYDTGNRLSTIGRGYVLSSCGRYGLRINLAQHSITRTLITDEMVFVNTFDNTLFDKSLEEPSTTEEVAEEVTSKTQQMTVLELFNAVLDRVTLTSEERMAMIARLSSGK